MTQANPDIAEWAAASANRGRQDCGDRLPKEGKIKASANFPRRQGP